jgi:RNA polymerase sigma-70 factor (ECF subfamily)
MTRVFRRYEKEDYWPRLYRLAYAWTRNVALAEDLAQEALMKPWHNRAQLRNADAGRAWLFSILANCHMDHLRRHQETEDIDTLHCR